MHEQSKYHAKPVFIGRAGQLGRYKGPAIASGPLSPEILLAEAELGSAHNRKSSRPRPTHAATDANLPVERNIRGLRRPCAHCVSDKAWSSLRAAPKLPS